MAIEFKLPEVSEGVTSVDIAEVKVAEGDTIEAGAVICEVETDKAVAEINCPHAGRISRILVKPGDNVKIGSTLVEIEESADQQNDEAPAEDAPRQDAGAGADTERPSGAQPESPGGDAPADDAETTGASSDNSDQEEETSDSTESSEAKSDSSDSSGSKGETREFVLPDVSEGVDAVDVAAVMVKQGDTIAAGAVVCEVETDKAVAEIACPFDGTITTVHIKPGDSIKVGAPLLTIATAAGNASGSDGKRNEGGAKKSDTARSAAGKSGAAEKPVTEKPVAEKTRAAGPAESTGRSASGKSDEGSHRTPSPSSKSPSTAAANRPPAPAGPATRRLARKLGVDLFQVPGTANGGRITLEDIEAFVRDRLSQPPAPASAEAAGTGAVAAMPLPDFSKFGPIDKQPMNKIFRMAAANLHAAWVTIPHVTQHDLADITELEAARKRYVKGNPSAPKITMTAIMIKAVVGALKAFPTVNSSVDLQAGELIVKNYYHIGVAVDTPSGLVVPVIRNCDQKNVLQVAAELNEIAGRARDRKLKTEEMQGGTFTITNLGGIGGTYFTPIVNYPEVAILGMSRGQSQLVLEDGQVTERLMLPLSLSYDHRALNGADAARFIVKLSSSLSNFFELF